MIEASTMEVFAATPQYYERTFSPVNPGGLSDGFEEGNWNYVEPNALMEWPWRMMYA